MAEGWYWLWDLSGGAAGVAYAPCYARVMLLVSGLGARGASESRSFQVTVSAAWGGEGSAHYRDMGQPRTQGRLVKG